MKYGSLTRSTEYKLIVLEFWYDLEKMQNLLYDISVNDGYNNLWTDAESLDTILILESC